MTQPIQPLYTDEHGTLRFKPNKIVEYLLEHGGIDMNHLACVDFPQEDREQFAQLTGYSLCGFSELSYVTNDTCAAAEAMHTQSLTEQQARSANHHNTLDAVREKMKELVPLLFRIHPDDLEE